MTDATLEVPRRGWWANAARLALIALVSAGYFATLTALYALAKAGVQRTGAACPPQILLVLACMTLSVASTGCYVLLRRGR